MSHWKIASKSPVFYHDAGARAGHSLLPSFLVPLGQLASPLIVNRRWPRYRLFRRHQLDYSPPSAKHRSAVN